MSLADIMFEQLAIARRIIEDGHEIVPAWRIATPAGSYLILTRFDPDKREQLQRLVELISRFMTWKMATSLPPKRGSAQIAPRARHCHAWAYRTPSG